jgi:hypothetical protein
MSLFTEHKKSNKQSPQSTFPFIQKILANANRHRGDQWLLWRKALSKGSRTLRGTTKGKFWDVLNVITRARRCKTRHWKLTTAAQQTAKNCSTFLNVYWNLHPGCWNGLQLNSINPEVTNTFFFFSFFWRYWGLNLVPTLWSTPPSLFVWCVFSR